MACGLLLTALCNFAFGGVANYYVHLTLWAMNGFVQGMGWPPCGRSMGHWFSVRERGTTFGVWNISANVGGDLAGVLSAGAASRLGWQYAFYFPGIIAVCIAAYLFWKLRDTPQSVGLPPVEEYKNDYTEDEIVYHHTHEKELTARELFIDNVLKNKYLWLFAVINFFVYIVRYSMLDWGPTYLREIKGASLNEGGIAVLIVEFGGIPSTLLLGWISDKLGGRRGMVSLLCMFPIIAAFTVILLNPPGHLGIDMTMLAIIGFFVYPPVMLIVLSALDLTSKKAVGTAAGFIGLFGYTGRMVQAKLFGWMVDHFGKLYGLETGWNIVIYSILGCTLMAIFLLAFTWKVRPKA